MSQWHDDPRGRYEKRWHDGEKWTAHVSSGGQVMTDPLGVGPSTGAPTPPPPAAPGAPPPPRAGSVQQGAKPDNYLVWAILTTLFCCLPFGIVSIVQSTKVDGAWAQGQHDEARRLSQSAKNWATVSAVIGVVVVGGYLLLVAGIASSG